MTGARVYVDGIALWAPSLPGWDVARAAFRGDGRPADPPAKRPAPQLLPPAERRRAPDTVALALEVAAGAIAQAAVAPHDLASVFVSAHGDLAINDAMCSTLVNEPLLVSPTKFHNSVHNAAAGYWTIGTGCMQASTALTAHAHSFAAGLVEAAALCATDGRPVLLVGFDVQACGALATVTRSDGLLAAALVLSPVQGARSRATVDWSLAAGPSAAPAPCSAAAQALTGNAMAEALPLFETLAAEPAGDTAAALRLPLGPRLSLALSVTWLRTTTGA